MAIAVGLDHSHQLGAIAYAAFQAAGVGTYGAGIHLYPGPLPSQAGLMGLGTPAGLGRLGHGLQRRLPLACRRSRVLAWAMFSF